MNLKFYIGWAMLGAIVVSLFLAMAYVGGLRSAIFSWGLGCVTVMLILVAISFIEGGR